MEETQTTRPGSETPIEELHDRGFAYRANLEVWIDGPVRARKHRHGTCLNCFLPTPIVGLSEEGLCSGCDPDAERLRHADFDYAAAHRMDR